MRKLLELHFPNLFERWHWNPPVFEGLDLGPCFDGCNCNWVLEWLVEHPILQALMEPPEMALST